MKIRFSSLSKAVTASFLFATTLLVWGPDFKFVPIQRQPNKETVITLETPTNGNYDILLSTNSVDWATLVTALSTNGSLTHTDSAAPFLAHRYYRGSATNVSPVTGDHLPTAAGDVIIHPGNHAGFVITWTNVTIYVDPSVNVFQGLPLADLILLTHTHGDHLNPTTINAIKGPNALILAPQVVYDYSTFSSLKSITRVLSNNIGTNLLGLRVDALAAYNYTAGRQSQHPTNVGNGYLLTIGGKRIYISGDTEDIPAMRALQNIDVAFLAINQPYTMTVDQAVSAVRAFQPKVVYPYHYSPSSPVTDLASFKQQLMTNPGTEVRLRKWY